VGSKFLAADADVQFGREFGGFPPEKRELVAHKLAAKGSASVGERGSFVELNAGGDLFDAFGVAALDSEDDAVAHTLEAFDSAFDGGGIDLAASDVDEVTTAFENTDLASFIDFAPVAEMIATLERGAISVWRPVHSTHGRAAHTEAFRGDFEVDAVEESSEMVGVGARSFRGIVGDPAAFAGAVKIVNFELRRFEDFAFEIEAERCARRDGKKVTVFENSGIEPGAPHCRDCWKGGGADSVERSAHGTGKRVAAPIQGNAVEKKGEHQAGEAVRVCH